MQSDFYNPNQDKGEIMKKLSILSALAGLLFCGAASAADITLYYSPYCPHCHHARDFFVNKMIYEYPNLRVVQINVMEEPNLPAPHAGSQRLQPPDGQRRQDGEQGLRVDRHAGNHQDQGLVLGHQLQHGLQPQ